MTRESIQKYWELNDLHRKDRKKRIFELIKQPESKTIIGSDFKPLFKYLLAKHAGLEFL